MENINELEQAIFMSVGITKTDNDNRDESGDPMGAIPKKHNTLAASVEDKSPIDAEAEKFYNSSAVQTLSPSDKSKLKHLLDNGATRIEIIKEYNTIVKNHMINDGERYQKELKSRSDIDLDYFSR